MRRQVPACQRLEQCARGKRFSRKIRQVVTNLVKNAAEVLGDQPGMVTISTGVMEFDVRTYSYLDVCDTGCGMDDETSSQLFEQSFTTKFDGHGLGTASIRRIVGKVY